VNFSSFCRRLAELVSCDDRFWSCRAMGFARLYNALGRTTCYHRRACMYGLGNCTPYNRYHRRSRSSLCREDECCMVCRPFLDCLCPRPFFSLFSPYITVQLLAGIEPYLGVHHFSFAFNCCFVDYYKNLSNKPSANNSI